MQALANFPGVIFSFQSHINFPQSVDLGIF